MLRLKLRLSPGSGGRSPKGVESRPRGGLFPSRAHARANKRGLKGSAVRADNYQQVITAKASMATIDVRQVEQGALRRTLRVAVLALGLVAVAGSLLAL